MNIATLRVEGSDEALSLIKGLLQLDVDAEWKEGSRDRNGCIREAAGFNCTIADVETSIELEKKIQEFLKFCNAQKMSFALSGVSAELDIGLGVGAPDQYTASIGLGAEQLAALARVGLQLRVSGYPCSD